MPLWHVGAIAGHNLASRISSLLVTGSKSLAEIKMIKLSKWLERLGKHPISEGKFSEVAATRLGPDHSADIGPGITEANRDGRHSILVARLGTR